MCLCIHNLPKHVDERYQVLRLLPASTINVEVWTLKFKWEMTFSPFTVTTSVCSIVGPANGPDKHEEQSDNWIPLKITNVIFTSRLSSIRFFETFNSLINSPQSDKMKVWDAVYCCRLQHVISHYYDPTGGQENSPSNASWRLLCLVAHGFVKWPLHWPQIPLCFLCKPRRWGMPCKEGVMQKTPSTAPRSALNPLHIIGALRLPQLEH